MPICAPDTHTRKVWEVSGLVTNFPCRRQYSDTDITVSFGARFLLLASALQGGRSKHRILACGIRTALTPLQVRWSRHCSGWVQGTSKGLHDMRGSTTGSGRFEITPLTPEWRASRIRGMGGAPVAVKCRFCAICGRCNLLYTVTMNITVPVLGYLHGHAMPRALQ